jgi:hypothetical protein
MSKRGCKPYKYYSVYIRKTDEAVVIHAKAEDCLKAIGLKMRTFRTYTTMTRNNYKRGRKYDIFVDEEDEDG